MAKSWTSWFNRVATKKRRSDSFEVTQGVLLCAAFDHDRQAEELRRGEEGNNGERSSSTR
jgi:hypothetical protein